MLLSPETFSSISNTEDINSHIMLATFIEKPRTTILFSFSPANCSPDEDIDLFYQQQTDQIK